MFQKNAAQRAESKLWKEIGSLSDYKCMMLCRAQRPSLSNAEKAEVLSLPGSVTYGFPSANNGKCVVICLRCLLGGEACNSTLRRAFFIQTLLFIERKYQTS